MPSRQVLPRGTCASQGKAITPGESCRETTGRSYEMLSATYDFSIALMTGGQNLASRLSQIADLAPGERALYVGAGSGEDAVAAARRGVRVTCLDLSPGMIDKARRRFERAGILGECVCADVMQYVPDEPFDAVVANFFLNIFTPPVMERVLLRLSALVRPGGKFLVADFAPARGDVVLRALHRLYYATGNVMYWMLGLCPLHPIYQYADYFERADLSLQATRQFRLFGIGPWMFQTTLAIRSVQAARGVADEADVLPLDASQPAPVPAPAVAPVPDERRRVA